LATQKDVETLEGLNYDVWATFPSIGGISFDVMVNNQTVLLLNEMDLSYNVKIPSVQALIDREQADLQAPRKADASWYDVYHTYAEYVAQMQLLARSFPTLVTFTASIGSSIEGRAIPALRIKSNSTTITRHILLQGGQHAREWAAASTTLYVAEKLLTLHATDASVRAILDRVTFDVIPIVNPDGYFYSWANSNNRLWRKNRRANTGGTYGVDLNRNWDNHWCEQGASRTPSSDTYCGTAPFSEPESKASSNFLLNAGYTFDAGIDFHAYSQLILRPSGWTTAPVADETLLSTVGTALRNALLNVNRVSYTSQPIWQLYLASGGANDWWYYSPKIKLAYCIEVRDTGTYGFLLPAVQLIPLGEENYAAVKYLANYVI